MSCNCGSITFVLPPNVCPATGTYTASNANLAGQGVYFDQAGNEFQFYGLTNTDGYVVVSLDAPNNAISIDLNPELISGSIPDSTTTVKGKTAYATDAETTAKTSTTKALTPSNLAALVSSTTLAGLTEYATNAETQSGSSGTLAVTPSGLKSVTDLLKVTQVTANATGRGLATPAFAGQLILQGDTKALYTAATGATGDWVGITVDNGNLSGNVNLSGATLKINTTTVPASSVLMTSSTPGVPTSVTAADNFLSNFNVITYNIAGFTLNSRTISDASTITLPQLADVVATLITDLMANVKPDAGG